MLTDIFWHCRGAELNTKLYALTREGVRSKPRYRERMVGVDELDGVEVVVVRG